MRIVLEDLALEYVVLELENWNLEEHQRCTRLTTRGLVMRGEQELMPSAAWNRGTRTAVPTQT